MKSAQRFTGLLACLVALAISVPASAAITLYDKEGTTFSTDGSFNTFYVYSDSDKNAAMEAALVLNPATGTPALDANGNTIRAFRPDRKQSRIKMGFLPNWIGFNFSKQAGDLKLGGRSSFWVTINDSDDLNGGTHGITDTGIDVRQFYATVGGDWGQVLLGKDFGLFSRSNIFLDEILQGYGNVSDTLGLIDGANVSFGNIGTGYIYPLPAAQITYRTPELAGFKLAIGLVDPSRTATGAAAEEDTPRFEGELTYNYALGNGNITAWTGFLHQKSEGATADVTSKGFSYGIKARIAGLGLHASGFDAEGVGLLLGPGVDTVLGLPVFEAGEEVDSDGYLLQASYIIGNARVVGSYGKNKLDAIAEWENETVTGAVFYAINENLSLVAEYNVNEIAIGRLEEETRTIALGGIVNF
jgi:predicted porin